jgi:predicted lactoylglutathione lyase
MGWEPAMENQFPQAVPEIPVSDINAAVRYYEEHLGFNIDWIGNHSEIAGISRGDCRIFLTHPALREEPGTVHPVRIWLNLNNRDEVNQLHGEWSKSQANIVSPPEAKPWKLYEFTAADPDGNLFRVFYDFAWEEKERPVSD